MESQLKCKNHNHPIQMICPTCKELVCFKCLETHARKGCKNAIDIYSYAKQEVLPKVKAHLDDFSGKKFKIEKSIQDLSQSFKDTTKGLTKLKKLLIEILENAEEALKAMKGKMMQLSTAYTTRRTMLYNEHKKLVNAIANEDINYLMYQISIQDKSNEGKNNPGIVVENEKQLPDNINATLLSMSKTKELERLNDLLKKLIGACGIPDQSNVTKIGKQSVYGICNALNCKKLCKYDVQTGSVSKCVDVPQYCTITQIGDKVFVSGGDNPIVNTLYEFIEDTQSLEARKSMRCKKCYHSTGIVTRISFMSIGGFDGSIPMAYCEEYSTTTNSWKECPALNRARTFTATALLNNRYLYAIGGSNSNNEIEMLDTRVKHSWITICLAVNTLKFDNSPIAFAISSEEILIIRGDISTETGILNVKDGTIKRFKENVKPDNYFYNSVCQIEERFYVIGNEGTIHIYDSINKKFEEINLVSRIS